MSGKKAKAIRKFVAGQEMKPGKLEAIHTGNRVLPSGVAVPVYTYRWSGKRRAYQAMKKLYKRGVFKIRQV